MCVRALRGLSVPCEVGWPRGGSGSLSHAAVRVAETVVSSALGLTWKRQVGFWTSEQVRARGGRRRAAPRAESRGAQFACWADVRAVAMVETMWRCGFHYQLIVLWDLDGATAMPFLYTRPRLPFLKFVYNHIQHQRLRT